MAHVSIPSIEEIKEALFEVLNNKIFDREEFLTLYDKAQTAKFLGVSKGTVDNLRVKGLLKVTYVGSKPMFSFSHIKEYINGNHHSSH
tara:strand:+ start:3472 stop:3735 length:264 start_codon:yes stop_codon:yes gene_type:complete